MTIQERLFESIPGFKEWIISTQLFHAIVAFSGNPSVKIEAFSGEEELTILLNDLHVSTPEELPMQIIAKFYENSPFKDKNVQPNYKTSLIYDNFPRQIH